MMIILKTQSKYIVKEFLLDDNWKKIVQWTKYFLQLLEHLYSKANVEIVEYK